jgi:FMN reductase
MNSEQRNGIRIVAIQGSVRPGNFTAKALALAVDEVNKSEINVEVVDPSSLNLTMPGVANDSDDPKNLQALVKEATGVIFSTPEYHGSFSSVIKLVIENLGFPSVLSGKPVALLGVAAGQIGAIKALEQLRSVCSHVGAIVLPGPVSLANVSKLFDEQGRCLDEKIEKRIRGVAGNLLHYIEGHICPKICLEEMVRSQAA